MKTLIGGAVAAILGIIGIVVWFDQFLIVLAGVVPVMLLLGGGLAVYLGFDELKDNWKQKDIESAPSVNPDEIQTYKNEIDELKKEVENLKTEKENK